MDLLELEKVVQVGSSLFGDLKAELVNFLKDHKGVFAWLHYDIEGINLSIIIHWLKVDPYVKPVAPKRHKFNKEGYTMINEEVKKLLEAGVVRE